MLADKWNWAHLIVVQMENTLVLVFLEISDICNSAGQFILLKWHHLTEFTVTLHLVSVIACKGARTSTGCSVSLLNDVAT